MSFVTKTGGRALINIGLAAATPISGLIHAPIWSEPDLVNALAQATGSSWPRNIPNFKTAQSLAAVDRLAVMELSPYINDPTRQLVGIASPTWESENVRHVHDAEWRIRWFSIQRLA